MSQIEIISTFAIIKSWFDEENYPFFCCFLAVASVTLNAQEIRPMPADSAYGVVHISVCNLRDEGSLPPV